MVRAAYRQYFLYVLLLLLAFNYVERQTLGLLLQEIKQSLKLTDTELGLLTGIAFAAFYAVMGIPIARWADRGNRVTIISLSAVISGIAISLCGAAGGFATLMLIRVAVGIGEAGSLPPSHSLIADHFERSERARAVSVYKLGIPLSMVIGYFASGWLNELYGWRITFALIGLPGILLGAIAWLTLREPRNARRSNGGIAGVAKEDAPPLGEVLRTLWSNKSYGYLVMGITVASFFGNGIAQWKSAFFIRSFGLGTGELGTWFALIYGVGGFLGTYWGGRLAAARAALNERLQLRGVALAYTIGGLFAAGIFISHSARLGFVLLTLSTMALYSVSGPLYAIMQTLVPPRMRAMSIALLFFLSNLIGLGFGPLIVGFLSDQLHSRLGEESLRYALLITCPGYLWCTWTFWRASRSIEIDLQSRVTQSAQESA